MVLFDDSSPIFVQIAEMIKNEILTGRLKGEERVKSTNDFAKEYQINPATARKGLNLLVEKELLYKKRGVGMFVSENAYEILLEERQAKFVKNYITPMLKEAKKLKISKEEVIGLLEKAGGSND